MKNRITYMIMAAAALWAGCSQEFAADTAFSDGEALLFTGAGPASTRTQIDTDAERRLTIAWAEADEVGIYGSSDGRSMGDNFAYVATPVKDAPTRCRFSAKDPYSMFKWINNTAQGYYAYYPYTEIKDRRLDATAHPLSLPSRQVQAAADSPAHIARYGMMTAVPVEIAASETSTGGIEFRFANIFSIVELRFKMTEDCSVAAVPVKQLELVSEAADLAIESGTIDLTETDAAQAIAIEKGSRSVTVNFENDPGLTENGYTSIYLVVAPGIHPAGTLRFDLTAIDNSVNSFTIPEGVEFEPNRHYVREYELSLDGFVQADLFDAEIPVLECKVGEPLTVTMTGIAETIDFWSGEEGHDYAYSDKDRMREAAMTMNFKMLLNSGTQRHPAKVKYSTDFDGTLTEAGILAATWTDVSEEFDMTHPIHGTDPGYAAAGSSTKPFDAGTADCTAWFSEEDRSCWVALFYHVDAYDASYVDEATQTKGNGRTYFYSYDMWVRATYKSDPDYTEIYRQKYADGANDPEQPTFVQGATFDDKEDGTNPFRLFNYTGYPYVLRLGAAFRPMVDRDSWLVLPKLVRPEAKNMGKDQPFVVKGKTDAQPESYEYVFNGPGTYEVVVVGRVTTLAGEKQIIKQATVVVTAE